MHKAFREGIACALLKATQGDRRAWSPHVRCGQNINYIFVYYERFDGVLFSVNIFRSPRGVFFWGSGAVDR